MLDIKFIRENQELVKLAIKNKNAKVDLDAFLAVDKRRRDLIGEKESLQAEQNKKSKGGPKDPAELEALKTIKERIKVLETEFATVEQQYFELLNAIPNIPLDDVPIGKDEHDNKVLREVGKKPVFAFKPKEHWELGKGLDLIDTERAAKVSGARFAYLKGALVMLEFALIQFALSVLTDEKILAKIIKKNHLKISSKPFTPIIPPVLIQVGALQKMARLEPKEERYHVVSDDLYLVGSAEHTLGAMHMDETLNAADFPLRYVGFSTAFRREAGSYGKDTKGILRVHQFDKLEAESFTVPEGSIEEQDFIVAIQEYLLAELGLPYRVVAISTGDMGGPDARQIDIETWMPGQDRYRETHTSDMNTDYQARRLGTRVKINDKIEFVHMNDATIFAGRTMISILENYQTEKGTVVIPSALRKYMFGIKEIKINDKKSS